MSLFPFMEMLTSREAADDLGVTVRSWHWIAEKYALIPAKELPGVRGAKLWHAADVERVKTARGAA